MYLLFSKEKKEFRNMYRKEVDSKAKLAKELKKCREEMGTMQKTMGNWTQGARMSD